MIASHVYFTTVKPASVATWNNQPPIWGSHIPGDGWIRFFYKQINHLQWPNTCERWPPDTYLCQKSSQMSCMACHIGNVTTLNLDVTCTLIGTVACIKQAKQRHCYAGRLAGTQEYLFGVE